MTAPGVLPDRAVDPTGFLLAAADVREKRIDAATPGPWHSNGHDEEEGGCGLLGGGVPGSMQERGIAYTTAFTNRRCHADAEHIAAEANPAHARAEVALWRACAAEHQRREGNVRVSLGAEFDSAGWRDGSPVLAAAVAAARAYLGGES